MKSLPTLFMMLTMSVFLFGCAHNTKETELKSFITTHVEKIRPMEKEASLASWDAAISGKPEDYDKVSELTLKVRQVYSNPQEFAFLKDVKESGQVRNAMLARQLDVLYNSYLETQIEPELLKKIVDLSTEIEKNFSTFRGSIEGKKVTDNEIKEILKTRQIPLREVRHGWPASRSAR